MKQLSGYLLFLFTFVISACQAQATQQIPEVNTTSEQVIAKDTLVYKIKETTTTPAALIILMHGYGSNEEDLFSLTNYLPENYIVVSLRAPMPLGQNSYQWFSIMRQNNITAAQQSREAQQSEQMIVNTIQFLQEKYKMPASKTFTGGFSQGGIMSYQLGLNQPQLLNGIFVLSGRMLPYVQAAQNKAKAGTLNIFIAHGDKDNVIAYEEASAAKDWLTERKYKVSFKQYEGLKHSINGEEIQDVLQFISTKLVP